MNLANLMNQSRQSFSEFWAARNARERAMLIVAAAVAAIGLIYAIMIDPALSGRGQLNKNLPALRLQVAQMQALSREAAAFSSKSAQPVVAITRESIEAALARKGLKPQSVMLTGDLAKVQFTAVSFAAMLGWLDEMQRSAQLAVVDANIVSLAQSGTVDATLTLRQQRHE